MEAERHGMRGTPIYNSWRGMKKRCYQKSHDSYKNYGERGIEVCSRWRESFTAFFEDMGPTWKEGSTIDRIDVDGDYCMENCRWATPEEQSRNKRNNVFVTVDGVTKVASEWDRLMGYKEGTVALRIKRHNMSHEDAVKRDPNAQIYLVDGEAHTVMEWAEISGNNPQFLYDKLKKGLSMKEVLLLKKRNNNRLFLYKGKEKTLREWCEELKLNYRTMNSRLTYMNWSVEKAFETPVMGACS